MGALACEVDDICYVEPRNRAGWLLSLHACAPCPAARALSDSDLARRRPAGASACSQCVAGYYNSSGTCEPSSLILHCNITETASDPINRAPAPPQLLISPRSESGAVRPRVEGLANEMAPAWARRALSKPIYAEFHGTAQHYCSHQATAR